VTKPHPAPFNRDALEVVRTWLKREDWRKPNILDPFAGIGRIHELRPEYNTFGVEIEPEWAEASPYTVTGDVFDLKRLMRDGSNILPLYFDMVVTSPVFGNRMSDHHDAKDDSRRITYRHKLGRPLHVNNSGRLNWGAKYRDFHLHAYAVLSEVGAKDFILNIKDHIRGGKRAFVSEFHIDTLRDLGWVLYDTEFIKTDGMGDGANHNIRVGGELVAWFKKGARWNSSD
jgi:hypothetical protein